MDPIEIPDVAEVIDDFSDDENDDSDDDVGFDDDLVDDQQDISQVPVYAKNHRLNPAQLRLFENEIQPLTLDDTDPLEIWDRICAAKSFYDSLLL